MDIQWAKPGDVGDAARAGDAKHPPPLAWVSAADGGQTKAAFWKNQEKKSKAPQIQTKKN